MIFDCCRDMDLFYNYQSCSHRNLPLLKARGTERSQRKFTFMRIDRKQSHSVQNSESLSGQKKSKNTGRAHFKTTTTCHIILSFKNIFPEVTELVIFLFGKRYLEFKKFFASSNEKINAADRYSLTKCCAILFFAAVMAFLVFLLMYKCFCGSLLMYKCARRKENEEKIVCIKYRISLTMYEDNSQAAKHLS